MKKIIAFLFILFLGILTSNAQVTFKPGIHAGVNLSKFTNSTLGNKTDFYIGGFGALKLGKIYTLQPELTYSRQGAKGTENMGETSIYNSTNNSYTTVYQTGTVNATLEYLSSVTINKINFTDNFYMVAGPFLDILIANNLKVDPKEKESNFNKVADIDLGIVGGFGYSLDNGISFEARVKKGLVVTYNNPYKYIEQNTTNLVFQFGATYTFNAK